MPSLKLSVPHRLSQEDASNRLRNFITEMKAQYGKQAQNVQESWSGNTGKFSFEVMGMAIAGVLDIAPGEVLMEAQIPMAALPFKGRIESQIRDKITSLLA